MWPQPIVRHLNFPLWGINEILFYSILYITAAAMYSSALAALLSNYRPLKSHYGGHIVLFTLSTLTYLFVKV